MVGLRFCVFIFGLALQLPLINSHCLVDAKNEIDRYSPLIIKDDYFVYPEGQSHHLIFEKDETVLLACPGDNSFKSPYMFNAKKNMRRWYTRATCTRDRSFFFDSAKAEWDIRSVECKKPPQPRLLLKVPLPQFSEFCSDPRMQYFVAGYNMYNESLQQVNLEADWFLEVLGVCYNPILNRPLMAVAEIHPAIRNKQTFPRNARSQFDWDKMPEEIQLAYDKRHQIDSFKFLFGKMQDYIKNDAVPNHLDNQYLERGHLVPKADLFYISQQEATFYYMNTAPMWKTINGGNWNKVEESVRKLAINKNRRLHAYTGTLGILELQNYQQGKIVQAFLSSDIKNVNNKFKLMIPELLFKLVYEPISQLAVVLVTVNNPFWSDIRSVICKNVIRDLIWILNMDYTHRYLHGFTYACTYDEFVKKNPYLPKLRVAGLLNKLPDGSNEVL